MSDPKPAAPGYLEVTYSPARLPPGDYPAHLARHLAETVLPKPGRLLDVGCGIGQYLDAFGALGYRCSGVDSAPSAAAAGRDVRRADLERELLPFPDSSFDAVFCKSVVEHLHDPVRLLTEFRRVLAPGGTAVVMTPSWRHQSRIFFEDVGHVKPFAAGALGDALTLAGFLSVQVRYFRQLPVLWALPVLRPLAWATALLPLPYRPWDPAPWPEPVNKWIRFSKELMLLGTASK